MSLLVALVVLGLRVELFQDPVVRRSCVALLVFVLLDDRAPVESREMCGSADARTDLSLLANVGSC